MGKKNKKNRNKKAKLEVMPKPEYNTEENSIKRFFRGGWKAFVGFTIVLGGIISWVGIENEWFTSSEEKFKKETSLEGDLKPKSLNDNGMSNNYTTTKEGEVIFFSDSLPNFNKRDDDTLPNVDGLLIPDLDKRKRVFVYFGQH